jgi:hypothetical protein
VVALDGDRAVGRGPAQPGPHDRVTQPAARALRTGAQHTEVPERTRGEVSREVIEKSQRRRVVQRGVRSALDQPACRPPLRERGRIVKRRPAADHGSGCIDVGTGVQQVDVVVAGSEVHPVALPVSRR